MLSRLLSLVLVVPMLLHGVFGCCWHHDHEHSSRADACEVDHDAIHHHGESLISESSAVVADEATSIEDDHSSNEGCHGHRCDFVASGQARPVTGKIVTELPPVFLPAVAGIDGCTLALRTSFAPCEYAGTRLRPHALCRVWLI